MVSGAFARLKGGTRSLLFALGAALIVAACGRAAAQTDFHAQLFRDAGEARARASALNAEMLAPKSFERGGAAYAKAENLYARHKPLDDIKEQIRLASQYFSLASDECQTAQAVFAGALKARSDASASDAARLSPEIWSRAEGLLFSAAELLEEDDTHAARIESGDAQGLYRSAELDAIEQNLLTPARELLARAKQLEVSSTAPQTLERAEQRLELAEAMVRQNRYEISEARRLAEEAKYEAAHAVYLHEIISQMHEHKLTFEDVILLSESAMGHIASALNTPVRFDGGYAPVVQQIITSVMSRDSARTQLAETLRRVRAENDALHRRLTPRGPGGGPPPPPGEGLAEERQRYISAAALAATYFAPNEGTVLRTGDTVVLRVFGLAFSRGEDAIEPGSAELLVKLEHAIHLFPNCRLTVEGHTEAGMSETVNQRNSEHRAAAVAAYLKKFPAASQMIESRGWGSSFPVADNTTVEGRARNRRIDILVTPE